VVAAPALVIGLAALAGAPARERATRLGQRALGALGPALVLGGYHWLCFGAPWRTGYSFIVNPDFAAGHASGFLGIRLPSADALWGLTFGTRRGLFYIAPVSLPLLIGLLARARERDASALRGGLAFVTLLLINASYYMWWGGAAAGPRHLVPVLGALALGLPWLWQRPRLRLLTLVLAAISLVNMLVIAGVGLEAPEQGDVLLDFAYERLARGQLSALRGASNLGLELGLVRGGTLGPLLVWLAAGAHVLSRQLRELDEAARARALPPALAPCRAPASRGAPRRGALPGGSPRTWSP
jgi:hypothetical protein